MTTTGKCFIERKKKESGEWGKLPKKPTLFALGWGGWN